MDYIRESGLQSSTERRRASARRYQIAIAKTHSSVRQLGWVFSCALRNLTAPQPGYPLASCPRREGKLLASQRKSHGDTELAEKRKRGSWAINKKSQQSSSRSRREHGKGRGAFRIAPASLSRRSPSGSSNSVDQSWRS